MLEDFAEEVVAERISKSGGLSCGRREFFSVVINKLIESLEELLLVGFSKSSD